MPAKPVAPDYEAAYDHIRYFLQVNYPDVMHEYYMSLYSQLSEKPSGEFVEAMSHAGIDFSLDGADEELEEAE